MTSPEYGRIRNQFQQHAGLMQRLLDSIPWHAFDSVLRYRPRAHQRHDRPGSTRGAWGVRSIAKVPVTLIVLWVIVLWWGERSVFRNSITACDWDHWEEWPEDATAHRVVLIADPQLVDPHTYPDRPWPLSSLTIRYTDLYLRRSFSLLNRALHPDTLFFLGDLFDGGREWATRSSKSPEPRYQQYGGDFWLREYDRFGRIFFRDWAHRGDHQRYTLQSRKIITGLPGNHDLGLGIGIQQPVRGRFNAYFGDGNAINIIGNHTFVSVDTVSLSAKGQLDPSTGRQGIYSEDPNADIWKPVSEFLDSAKDKKARLLSRELHLRAGQPEYPPQEHTAINLSTTSGQAPQPPALASTDLPSILLTHVPLYRAEGTPCGPLREHCPPSPSRSGEPLDKDDANAIAIQAGYQYQNVLTPALSSELIEKIGNVQQVFSGDDHDYCEVVHRGYTATGGGVREITVKSMSWAMGVRRPGFLLVSLWNPVDATGTSLLTPAGGAGTETLQTHLCLLPDQLAIFIRYAMLLAFTFAVLIVRAIVIAFGNPTSSSIENDTPHLLPLSKAPADNLDCTSYPLKADSSSGASALASPAAHSHINASNLAVRPTAGRPRDISPAPGGYAIPISIADAKPAQVNPLVDQFDRFGSGNLGSKTRDDDRSKRKRKGRAGRVVGEVAWALWRVAWVVGAWYTWLLWNG